MSKKIAKQTSKTSSRTAKKRVQASRGRNPRRPLLEADSTYFLKLVVILLLSTLWLKFHTPLEWGGIPMRAAPVGAIGGLLLVKLFEKSQTDRKIWYAVLLVVGIVSYFVPAGIVL